MAPQAARWIASSRSLSSGAHSRDPLAPRNDEATPAHSRGRFCPGFSQSSALRKQRAQGRPDASRTRSLVCSKKHTSMDHRYAETIRPSLRDGLAAYTCSPRCTGLFSHRPPGLSAYRPQGRHRLLRGLTPASGDRDHTVSPSASLVS